MDRLAVHAVALVVVHRRDRRVDRDLVEVRAAEPRDLRVDVRVDAARSSGSFVKSMPGTMCAVQNATCSVSAKKLSGLRFEHHAADRAHRHQLLGNDLGRVEHVEAEALRLLLGEDLQAELPLGIGARLDRLPQVAAMEVGVGAGDLHRLVPDQRVRARRPASSGTCTKCDSPAALTSRKVCTPKPCIIR